MNIIGADCKDEWRKFGTELGLSPADLNAIGMRFPNSADPASDCMLSVFSMWSERETEDYSWKKLAEVLCSRNVNKPGLLNKVCTDLSHLYQRC